MKPPIQRKTFKTAVVTTGPTTGRPFTPELKAMCARLAREQKQGMAQARAEIDQLRREQEAKREAEPIQTKSFQL